LQKVHLILRDAARVMRATTNKLGIDSFDCFLHKIQLAIEDGCKLAKIEEKCKNARRLVTRFNKSEPFRSKFYEWQKKFDLPKKGLIQVI